MLKIKNLYSSKYTIKRKKGKLQTGKKYLENIYLTKDLDPEYTKKSENSVRQHDLKNGKYLNRHFTTEYIQMSYQYLKRCSISLII